MKSYNYYLFDADGTLFDTIEMICRCFEHITRKHTGKELEKKQMVKCIGLPLREQLESHLGIETDYDKVIEDYSNYQLEIMEESLQLFPEVKKTLGKLKEAGKKLAIVTSRRKPSLLSFLKITDTAKYFDALVTPEDTEKHKPNPEPALLAMDLIGADKESTVFIGDAMFDICSGHSAGVDTVFVNWSHNKVEDMPVTPTFTIDKMSDLLK